MNPEKKYGTILFCDIRNFTSLFDNKDPIEAANFASNLTNMGMIIQEWGVSTQKGDKHFLHVLDYHRDPIFIPNFPGQLKTAVYFNNGEPVEFNQIDEGVVLTLDEEQVKEIDTVIEFSLKE